MERAPLTGAQHVRRGGELGDRGRMVHVQMGHDRDPHVARLDALLLAQLRGDSLLGSLDGVDCASRRPRFCFGSVATDGWKPVSMIIAPRPGAHQERDDRQLHDVSCGRRGSAARLPPCLGHRHELGARPCTRRPSGAARRSPPGAHPAAAWSAGSARRAPWLGVCPRLSRTLCDRLADCLVALVQHRLVEGGESHRVVALLLLLQLDVTRIVSPILVGAKNLTFSIP